MRALTLLALVAALAAGCGGSDSDSDSSDEPAGGTTEEATLEAPAWAEPLLAKPGPEGALVLATSDFAAGDNRLGFLLVRENGSLVTAPLADVSAADGQKAVARLVDIGTDESSSGREEVKR